MELRPGKGKLTVRKPLNQHLSPLPLEKQGMFTTALLGWALKGAAASPALQHSLPA